VTPFREDGGVDVARFAAHAVTRLAAGCASVTAFGTTGEGPSIDTAGREQMLTALRDADIDMGRQLVACVCTSAVGDAVAQQQQAAAFGCRTLLLAPPFYFKAVNDAGLFAWFAPVLESAAANRQQAILYHIPSVTAVSLSADLIERLHQAYPDVVCGVKDSSGDWAYGQRLLQRFPSLMILIGDERRLAQAVRLGASGAISGLANFIPELLLPLVNEGRDDERVVELVNAVLQFPVTPAVKDLVARMSGDPAWRRVAPPLSSLAPADAATLSRAYDGIMAERCA